MKTQMPFNNEIEKTKKEIKVLEKKLSFLEELEKTKSPVEEAFKDWMGVYPPTNPSVDNIFDIRWRAFQMGYNSAQKDYKVGEYQETSQDNDKNFKNSLDLIKEWGEKNKPPTLYQLIENWWCDVFCANSMDDMETCIDGLVSRIEAWLPDEQSAAGSQNAYVECTVEGYNDCLNKIKRKLR